MKFLKPICKGASSDTVAGCLTIDSPLEIYNFQLQMAALSQNDALCGTKDATTQWMRNVSEDYINCCEANQMEFNFFMDMFSSNPKRIESTNMLQRYRSNEDENVVSGSAILDAAGNTNRFQLSAGSHSGGGLASSLVTNEMLYNYRTKQTLKIKTINSNVPGAHVVSVINTRTGNVDIAKNDKFIRIPAVAVGGNSCPVGGTTMNTHFTTKGINKLRLRKEWCMDMEVDKPYADLMMFAPWVDKNGKTSQRALPIVKMRCMQELTQAANLMLFLGNAIDNPAITSTWAGGEGLLDAISGAGKEWDYDPALGFSLINDFEAIILEEDGKKKTDEWMLMGSINFLASMTERTRKDTQNEITPLDFGTIQRFGASKADLEKYSVLSFKYLNRKVMFREWKQLNVSNGIGNGHFPDLGIMLAMNGLTNSKGEVIPPMQFYRSESSRFGTWEDMIENDRDQMKLQGCEQIKGDIIKTMFWIVNCPDAHRLINPVYCS